MYFSYPISNNLVSAQSFRGGRWVLTFCSTNGHITMTNIFIASLQSCTLLQHLWYVQLFMEASSKFCRIIMYLYVFFRQEALLAAISEKDANIALLELSSSKKKTQDEVAALKREKDRLVQQLKQQVSRGELGKKLINNLM